MLLSEKDILQLHKKYAPTESVFELVYTHCKIVRDIALQLIDTHHISVDKDLVIFGAMLHDIGVYPLFGTDGKLQDGTHYITHGTEGEKLLRKENLPEIIWRFASHHTGVGLSKDDIVSQNLPLPIEDYFAETDEELLVMYADKFHSKTTPPQLNSFAWYQKEVSQFGPGKAPAFEEMALKFGKPDLMPLSRAYFTQIR